MTHSRMRRRRDRREKAAGFAVPRHHRQLTIKRELIRLPPRSDSLRGMVSFLLCRAPCDRERGAGGPAEEITTWYVDTKF